MLRSVINAITRFDRSATSSKLMPGETDAGDGAFGVVQEALGNRDGPALKISDAQPVDARFPLFIDEPGADDLFRPALRERLPSSRGGGLGAIEVHSPSVSNSSANLRAEIRVGNVVVARVYNSGVTEVADGYESLSNAAVAAQASRRRGPNLADQMITRFAGLLERFDVSIDWAKTALSQAEWQSPQLKSV